MLTDILQSRPSLLRDKMAAAASVEQRKCVATSGERDGIRTHDLLIKSQMLYQLSYALLEERGWSSRIDATGQ